MFARTTIAFLALLLALTSPLAAQESTEARMKALDERLTVLEAERQGIPGRDFHLSGYANVQYAAPEEGKSTFSALFAPIFLFKAGDRVLFEGELEFEFEGETTETGLEYAQLDYMFSDVAILVAGKFLLPFGQFGERGHPSWINKLPTPPIIYAGHGGTAGGIIPVLSDFGAQLRGGFSTGTLRWNYAAYLVNGPRPVTAGGHEEDEEEEEHGGGTTVNYAASSEDDNNNKAFGLRLAALPVSGLEIGVSYYTGGVTYNKFEGEMMAPGDKTEKSITLTMVDFAFQLLPLEIRGEYLIEDSSALNDYVRSSTTDDTDMIMTEAQEVPGDRTGYWVQASYAFGGWLPEVVLRYGSGSTDGEEIANQTGLGLNWWLDPSLVLKLAAVSNTIKMEETETTTDYYVAVAMGF